MKKITVLVVEDSFLMRKIISDIINSDPDLEVIDTAKNGQEAVEKALLLRPDMVTLDIDLPVLDGIGALKEIMQRHPTRVIMLSAYTREGTSATIKALELGAIDFITKPSGKISLDLPDIKENIISKIKLAAKVGLNRLLPSRPRLIPAEKGVKAPLPIKKLVIIGASTGGPKIVIEIMQGIPADVPAAFLIVQHMPKGFTASLAERISWESQIKAKEAEDGDVILPGKAYIAAAEYHMVLERLKGSLKIKLTKDEMVNFVRPSVDVTMLSAVEAFGDGDIIGVILSGMGKDGLEGAREIKGHGGLIIVQDEETSIVWGMPKAVYDEGLADKVLPISKITAAIIEGIRKRI